MPENQSTAGVGRAERDESGRWKAPPSLYVKLSALAVIISLMVGYHYSARGLARYPAERSFAVPSADPERGPELFQSYGCVGCHEIPGVPGADGKVGPPLNRLHEQSYIAGVLTNTPQHLIEWIRRPQEIDPYTAMPSLGVRPEHARDMAAYLYQQP